MEELETGLSKERLRRELNFSNKVDIPKERIATELWNELDSNLIFMVESLGKTLLPTRIPIEWGKWQFVFTRDGIRYDLNGALTPRMEERLATLLHILLLTDKEQLI